MEIKVDATGLQEVIKRLERQMQIVGYDMASRVVGNLAAMARRPSEKLIGAKLQMGKSQHTVRSSRGGLRVEEKVFSRYDSSSGAYVSTTRKSGGNPWKLSRFTWETRKFQKQMGKVRSEKVMAAAYARARYTSTMANLWENDTRPYGRSSPLVGRDGSLTRIRAGETRRGIHVWGQTERIFSSMQPDAIQRTEREFAKEFDG